MHTKEPREDPLVEMGYEVRDVDFPKLRWAIIIFFGFFGLCSISGWFIYANRFKFFAVEAPKDIPGYKQPMPPGAYPLIQGNVTSKTDIATLRQAETARMTSTGPNPDGSVHIPIDRAMSLIAARGVAATHASVPAVSKGSTFGKPVTMSPTVQTGIAPTKPTASTPAPSSGLH